VFTFLLVVLLLVGVIMTIVVLLQAGKGGGLAAVGGGGPSSDNLIGGRQAATLLTKATWVTGGLFLFLALALSVLSSRQAQPTSVLRGQFQAPAAAPTPVLPGAGEQAPEGAAPGAPASPITPAPEGGAQQPQP
jgi:preprotein translocase subunit SecG